MKKWILIGVGVVVLLAGAIGGTLFATGALGGSDEVVVVPGEDGEATTAVVGEVVPVYVPKSREIFYFNIQPEFVVNFRKKERPRTLMVEITVASYHEESLEVLDTHSPELRNNLLLLLSEQSGPEMSTVEGKNKVREQVKETINKLLRKHVGAYDIDDIYFIRFVLQ